MIKQKYRKCKTCGCIGGIFVTRSKLLASGRLTVYIDNQCTWCANQNARERYYKRRKNPLYVEQERQRLREYKRNHKEKIKAQARLYWLKNKMEITRRRNLRKEIKEKEKNKLIKHSHHRVPSKNHPLRGFDFRMIKTMRGR